MASAWQGPPPSTSAEPPAGGRAGVKAFALITTETLPNRAGRNRAAFKRLLMSPSRGHFLHGPGRASLGFSPTHGLRPSLFPPGRLLRCWQSFGRAINFNFGAGRWPDFVPAGHGAAYVFKTGRPSLLNSSAGKFVVLHEARP